MKFLFFYLGSLVFLFSAVSARSAGGGIASGNDPSRTLKGVLKYYKEQARETDSESLEFESNEVSQSHAKPGAYRLDLNIHKEEDIVRPIEKVKEHIKPILQAEKIVIEPETPQVLKVQDEEINGETTTLLSISEDAPLNSQYLPKSDLYSDDLDDIDVDGCNEGDVMKVSCNTCVCSDGTYFCSKRECNDKTIPLPPLPKPSDKRKGIIKYHKVKTDVGSSSENGTIGIDSDDLNNGNYTIEGENSNGTIVDNSQCIDGRTKPVDCNQCVCALGKWACTKMSCIALSLREKASFSGAEFLKKVDSLKEHMSIDDDCMEGETKQLGCNQCVCHQHSWACSDFKCPSTEAPVKLPEIEEACQTEEDVKSKDCNICSCRRGVWVCTNNDCKKFGDRYYNPISQKHTSNENDNDQEI